MNWAQFRDDWQDNPYKSVVQKSFLILDEAQKIKNPDSLLGRVAASIIGEAARAVALTATLVQNRAHDAWAIVKALDPNFMSLTVFEALYTIKELGERYDRQYHRKRKFMNIVGYRQLEEFRNSIKYIYFGRTDEEMAGLRPEIQHLTRRTVMPEKQREIYLEAEKGAFTAEGDNVTAAIIQAQQAADCPEIYDPTCKENAKAELLGEIFDEIGDDSVVIYSRLRQTVDRYMEIFKSRHPVRITGAETSDEQRAHARKAFQEGTTNTIFITDAGGESLNLQKAKHVIFLNRPWSPGVYVQIVGRARRVGSAHSHITVWHLTCRDTMDEYTDAVIAHKFGDFEKIIAGRGNLVPEDQVFPLEIAKYARQKRIR